MRARCAIRALFFCLYAWFGSAHGAGIEATVAPAVLDFGYKEYADSGALLNREDGPLPGLVMELARRFGAWRLSGEGRLFSGTVDHVGQTNLGVPITTRTDEKLYALTLRIAREVNIGSAQIAPYVGYGYQEWHRSIDATHTSAGAPVSGLSEVYTWKVAEIGALVSALRYGRFTGGVDVRVFRVVDPEVRVRFTTGFDDARLSLGEKSGRHLGLSGTYMLAERTRVRVDFYQERWAFGRSSSEQLTSGGAIVGSVFEPRSETRNTGLNVGVTLDF